MTITPLARVLAAALPLLVLLAACGSPRDTPPEPDPSPDAAPKPRVDGGALLDLPALDAAPACATTVEPGPGIVFTDRGAVRGTTSGKTRAFRGIPYAASPTGERRWRPPVPAACWEDLLPAVAFGAKCPQLDTKTKAVVGAEDCLTLNVWTPTAAPAKALPVLFFIHGGYNVRGSSGEVSLGIHPYDGSRLAEDGPAVVVTVNYRLGALGFLNHRALDASDGEPSGNYALLDLIAALKWVQANIERFGGDRQRVLVFGQSAGGVNICSLLGVPAAAGLFSRAMLLSGPCVALGRDSALAAGERLAAELGCGAEADVSDCLRGKPAKEIAALSFSDGAAPTVDGELLPDRPMARLAAGLAHPVPLIFSDTAAEYSVTTAAALKSYPVADEQSYLTYLTAAFVGPQAISDRLRQLGVLGAPVDPTELRARYPVTDYSESYLETLTALFTDLFYLCPNRRAARSASAGHRAPVWRAHFGQVFANQHLAPYGAAHGFDVFFGFKQLGFETNVPTTDELALSEQMARMWVRFAETGDPGAPGGVAWPAYGATTPKHLRLQAPMTQGEELRAAQCDYWDTLL